MAVVLRCGIAVVGDGDPVLEGKWGAVKSVDNSGLKSSFLGRLGAEASKLCWIGG
jgi:hypothetical protein